MGKMKAFKTFDAWNDDQTEEYQGFIKTLRRFIKTEFKKLDESVKWGNGVWLYNNIPVCYMYGGYEDHFQFGFFGGANLKDPKGLLQGKGAHVRAIRIKTKKDIDKEYIAKLIRQALKNCR
jgi:hypothetical protein